MSLVFSWLFTIHARRKNTIQDPYLAMKKAGVELKNLHTCGIQWMRMNELHFFGVVAQYRT